MPQTDQPDSANGYVTYTQRVPIDLYTYAFFVRMSLENLIEKGHSLDPGEPACPDLTPDLFGPRKLWEPENLPKEWHKVVPWDMFKSLGPYTYLLASSRRAKPESTV